MSNYDPDALAVPGSRLQPKRTGVTITIAPPATPASPPSTPSAPPSPAALNPVQPAPAKTGRIGTDPSQPPPPSCAPAAAPQSSGTVAAHPVQPQPTIPITLANGSGSGARTAPIYNGLISSTRSLAGLGVIGGTEASVDIHPAAAAKWVEHEAKKHLRGPLERLRDVLSEVIPMGHGKDEGDSPGSRLQHFLDQSADVPPGGGRLYDY